MTGSERPARFTEAQRVSLEARQADQDRTLAAMHELEAALGGAAPGREEEWRAQVVSALRDLADAVSAEAANAEQPDSLVSDISRTQPWLRNRVRALRIQFQHLSDNLGALLAELSADSQSAVDFADIRQRLGWVLYALRHQRARESDLIYEAYYEAFGTDLGRETDKFT